MVFRKRIVVLSKARQILFCSGLAVVVELVQKVASDKTNVPAKLLQAFQQMFVRLG